MGYKIVRIIARLNVGGPAIHTILLTHGLNARGHRSCLVTGTVDETEGDMDYYAAEHRVAPIILPGLGRRVSIAADLRVFSQLVRLLCRERPDIIHSHTAKAGVLGRTAAVVYNIRALLSGRQRARVVHTFHGHLFHGYFSAVVSRGFVWIERILARVTDRVVTVSESIRQDLVERYRVAPARKVDVVPLGFSFEWVEALDACAGARRRHFDVPPSAIVMGVVGRLTDIKNHDLLLAALTRMDHRGLRVLVLGDGERRAVLEQQAHDMGLAGVVHFAGWEQNPARLYADLDIVCLTSRNEGTPVALIEAMAAGRAFVATRVGGVPDLMMGEPVEHAAGFHEYANGILVPADDADALAAALAFLIARPGVRRAMGSVGQAAVLKRFSQERLLDDVERLYGRLMGDMVETECAR